MTSRQRAERIMQGSTPFTGYGHIAERDSPRRELSDEVVAGVQNFQFLCFTQPFWHGLHMVPTGGEGVMMMINHLQFVKRYTLHGI